MNLFTQAKNNMPLTPAERSLLRALQGLVITFLIAAVPIVWTAVTAWANGTDVQMNWALVIDNATKAGVTAAGFVVWKFFSAIQDTVKGQTTDVGHAQGQSSLRPNGPSAAQAAQAAQQTAQNLGLDPAIVGDIASAVSAEIGAKLGLGTGVVQIPAFQPFNIPDGTVVVKAPNGVSLPVPADALPPADPGTSGSATDNGSATLSASSAPVASNADSAGAADSPPASA